MDFITSFLNYLEFEKRYSTRTIESYRTDLMQFNEFCISNKISDLLVVDHKLIRGWIVILLEENCQNRSVNRKISTLKSFYKYLLRQGHINYNPLLKVESLKTGKQLPAFVTTNQTQQLFTDVEFGADFHGVRNKLILELFYATGIRLSELVNLKITDIDKVNLTIKVLGKRNKERIIPITKEMQVVIDNYLSFFKAEEFSQNAVYLIVTDKGEQVYPKFVYRVVTAALKLVSTQDKRSPHVLRHTFATHMLNNGAEINAIKELLGHSSLAATQVYTHNTFEKLKKIYKQAHPRA
jgi:integrase/recombinase XerC